MAVLEEPTPEIDRIAAEEAEEELEVATDDVTRVRDTRDDEAAPRLSPRDVKAEVDGIEVIVEDEIVCGPDCAAASAEEVLLDGGDEDVREGPIKGVVDDRSAATIV